MLAAKIRLSHLYVVTQRSSIVQGLYEPNDEDCDFPSDDEKDEELANEIKTKVKIEDVAETKEPTTE